MTTPVSPPITMLDVLAELQIANPSRSLPISLNDSDVRALAGIPSGTISLLQLLNRSSAAPVNPLTMSSLNYSYLTSSSRSVWVNFNPDGDLQSFSHGNVLRQRTSWFSPDPTPGIGNSYWIRATLQSGTAPASGAVGQWLQLNATRSWTYTAPSGEVFSSRHGVLLIQIATDAAGSNIVSSGTISLRVDRESNG